MAEIREKELEEWERHARIGGNVRPRIALALIEEVRTLSARAVQAEAERDELLDPYGHDELIGLHKARQRATAAEEEVERLRAVLGEIAELSDWPSASALAEHRRRTAERAIHPAPESQEGAEPFKSSDESPGQNLAELRCENCGQSPEAHSTYNDPPATYPGQRANFPGFQIVGMYCPVHGIGADR